MPRRKRRLPPQERIENLPLQKRRAFVLTHSSRCRLSLTQILPSHRFGVVRWLRGLDHAFRVPGIQFTTENLRQHLVPPSNPTREDPYAVSYAHADGEIVFREILKLHEAGYRIWFDEGIEPGNDWPQHIAQAVVNCSLFLIFTSPRSVASENCRNEVNLALNRKKKFLSIYLEETELPLGLELRMGDLQAVLKYKMPELSYRKKVFASLEKLLGTEGRDLPQGEDPVAKLMEQKSQADRLAMPSQRKQSEASGG